MGICRLFILIAVGLCLSACGALVVASGLDVAAGSAVGSAFSNTIDECSRQGGVFLVDEGCAFPGKDFDKTLRALYAFDRSIPMGEEHRSAWSPARPSCTWQATTTFAIPDTRPYVFSALPDSGLTAPAPAFFDSPEASRFDAGYLSTDYIPDTGQLAITDLLLGAWLSESCP